MGVNQIQQAVEEYERTIKAATADFERICHKAELDLRAFMNSSEKSEPLTSSDIVTMTRYDYEQLQDQLKKVSDFIKKHPEIGANL